MRALSRLAATGRAARRSRAFAPVLTSSNSVRCLATEAFVSRHYQMQDPKDVADFLRRKSLAVRETDSHFVVRDCPFCHATHGKADNLFKMYVHKTQGVYKCHRCGSAGSWFDFKHKLQGSVGVASASSALHGGSNAGAAVEVKIIQALDNEKAMAIQKNLLDDSEFEPVLKYLTDIRGLTKEVLQKYCVGAIEQPFWDHDAGERVNAKCISFPWMARQMDMNAMGVMCQAEYSILNSKHFIGIHGYMLVYSVSSLPSFEMVQVIREKILNHLGTESVPICIVGNKSDLRPEQRQVTPEDGQKLSEKIQCGWTEASARYNENVGKAFELLIGQIEKSQNPGEAPAKSNCILM